MGVRGLTTYIAANEKAYLQPHCLCNSYLLIDGNSVACQLYDHVSKGESAFGGDYDEYYAAVKGFFQMLEMCAVTPIVFNDGGYERKKIKTVLSRQGEKFYLLKYFTKGYSPSKVFPLFMSQTFVDVVNDLGILCIQCEYEADAEIAAVARALECPVLSYDSDFYIFDVLYIPFSSVEMTPVKVGDSNDYCLRCSMYNVTNFLEQFDGLDKSMLPVIATLLGNDYIGSSTFKKFFNHVSIPKRKKKSYTQRKIEGVLHWMEKENVESATQLILTHLENKKAGVFLKAIKTSISDYTNSFVSDHVLAELSKKIDNISLKKKDVVMNLPLEILELYHQYKINRFIMNMINLGIYVTQLQIEDLQSQSSHLPSLQLITDIHRMVAQYSQNKNPLRVYLTLRNSYGALTIKNPPSDCLKDFDLGHMLKQPRDVRLKLLCQLVGVGEDELNIVSCNNWSLFIISFVYWVRKMEGQISFAHAHALILMAIANECVQKQVGYFRNSPKFMKKKGHLLLKFKDMPIAVGTSEDFSGMLEDVTLHEKLLVQNALLPYRRVSELAQGKGYCILTLHLFSCFQSCLFHIMQLNGLLDQPLPNLEVSDFYSGTLLFNFYLAIRSKPPCEKFGTSLFQDKPNLLRIYEHLQRNLCKYLGKQREWMPKKRKKRKK